MRASQDQVEKFINDHKDWIEKHLKAMEERQKETASVNKLSVDEIRELADKALKAIPARVKYYAPLLGVFNCLLMLTPPEVIDSVVVHELAHLKEMNHSERFYAEILRMFPDYWKWHGWLKENGRAIMARMISE